MHKQRPHQRLLISLILGLAAVWPTASAQGQNFNRDQDYYRDVIALSETLGKAHAIRTVCNGRNDQHWRSYMLRLLDLEAPYQGGLRRSMVNGFNAGFSWGQDQHRRCDRETNLAEEAYASEGRDLSARLVQANIPGSRPPPAAETDEETND